VEPTLDAASKELEELRAAEEATLDDGAKRAVELLRATRRLGPGHPLGQRLDEALAPGRTLPFVPDPAETEAAALAAVGVFDIDKARKLYDIPVEMNPLVAEYIRFFQGPARKHFVKWLSRSHRYLPMMKKRLREEGLPEDTVYLAMIESGFSNLALSRAKAAGTWQFIQPTGIRFGLRVDFWVDERRDPVRATAAAAQYLRSLYEEFGDWRLAWAGYNAGENKVRGAIKLDGTTDFWEMVKGRVLRKETKHYVPKLMAAALLAKHLKLFGFDDSEVSALPPLAYAEVEVPEATDLEVLASAAGVTVDSLRDLNPELRRFCTPPPRVRGDVFRLKLPVGTEARFAESFAKVPPKDRLSFRAHHVGRGDTLSKIAAQHGSATEAIMRMNGLRDSRKLRVGTELLIPVPRGSVEARAHLSELSRRRGYVAAPPDQEVPAGTPPAKDKAKASGVVRRLKEGGRDKLVYAVAIGDSLWSLGQHFGVSVEDLKKWNGLTSRRVVLRLGQELAVYPSGPATAAKAQPTAPPPPARPPEGKRQVVHVLSRGDTLGSVALRYDVSVEDIQRWNRIEKPGAVRAGQNLTLHVGGKARR
jgi:membrane-bound lytic murein transglycosylase D